MKNVSVRNVTVSYSSIKALENVSVEFPAGSLSILLGLNGSGKTTLLKTIAGLVEYDGRVLIGGEDVDDVPPSRRGISYVPQNNALIPTLKVWWNIALGLIDRVSDRRAVEERVLNVAKLLEIQHLLNKLPAELSGGEARRVAIARALVLDSDVVLMDEPDLSVDVQTWQIVFDTILKMKRSGKTVILSMHNFEEALSYASFLCILHGGRVLYAGNPSNLEPVDIPLATKTWLGSILRVDDVECSESGFCTVVVDGVRIYAGSRRDGSVRTLKALIPPKYVVVGEDGVFKGRVVGRLGYVGGRWILLVDYNGRELIATSREDLSGKSVVGLRIERAILLGGPNG